MSITKAQLEFLAANGLSDIGTERSEYDLNLNALEKLLNIYGGLFIERAKANLTQSKSIASGEIADIKMFVTQFGTKYRLSLGYPKSSPAAKYYDFVNKGVKGTKNKKADEKTKYKFNPSKKSLPSNVIKDWLKYNKVKSSNVGKYRKVGAETKGQDMKETLARYLAKKIHRDGLRSTHYFDNAKDDTFNDEFKDLILKAIGADIKISIKQMTKEFKKESKK